MRILRFDSVGGASGDMILGALLGLGADREKLEKTLGAMLPGHFHLRAEPVRLDGLSGLRASVDVHEHEHEHHHHDHHHAHEHGHEHEHEHGHHHHHGHHNFGEIRALIEAAALPAAAKARSIGVFALLAEAEGKVHGVAPEQVAFHEVGAVDSIVDVVGCCLAFEELGIDAVSLSVLPTGTGTVRCAHGLMPVPAPATAELIAACGLAVTATDEPSELLTPTGAALLGAWPKAAGAEGRVVAVANSFGQRTLAHRPNLLRAMLLETAEEATGPVIELAANLDDLTPELAGHLIARLLEAGALDAAFAPLQMKKQRPGMLLAVIAEASKREVLLDLIFRESTTFGVREYAITRHILERSFETVETSYGPIRIKRGFRHGELVTSSPEFEECRAAAARHGVPLKTVMAAALAALK